MTFVRLSVVAPELVDLLRAASTEQLLRVSAASVGWALAQADVVDARLEDGTAALAAQQFGDSAVRARVNELVEELDVVARDIQDTGDNPGYLAAFTRARAANALWYALVGADLDATMECVYEAFATSDVTESLIEAVISATRGV